MRIKGTHTYIGADNQQEVQKEDIELDVLGFNNINVTGKNTDEFNVSVYFNNAEDVVSTGDELDNYKFNSATAFYNGYANGPDHIREINIRLEDTDNYYNRNIITTTISTMNGATEEFVNQMWEELNEVVEVETGYDIDTILGTEKEKADQRRAQAEEDELKITGEYPPEVIERAQKIFDTCKLEGADIHIDKDGISVLVRDTVNNVGFWFDIYPSKEGDLEGDWNQYIFNNTITEDLVREALQENGRFFEAVFEVAEDYAMEKDAIKWNDETNKYEFKTESKKVNKKENKKGISRYLKEDFYDGDGGYDEADWEEEVMGEEREDVEEYIISFEPGELYDQYHGEFITEDKDEADDLFDEIKEEHKLDQVDQYIRKVWEWDRVNEEYYETDVEVYFNAGDELEYYDESKKTEDLSVEEENKLADDIEKYLTDNQLYPADVFAADTRVMVEIHWGDWKHDHLRCDSLMEAKGYGLVEEEVTEEDGSDCYSAIRHYEPEGKFDNVDIQESKKTEGYSLGDDKESFDVYKHTAEFLNKVGKELEELGWKYNKETYKFEKEDITIDMEAIQDNVNDLYIGSNKLKLSKFADDFSGYEDIGEDTGIIYYVNAKADDYEARQLANKIDRCDVITESRKTEAKPEEADKEIWEKVEHIVDAADNELGPDQSAEYDYDEHIKFVIYRDFEYEDIFEVYTYVYGKVQEDLDTGDVHLEDLDATIVDIVKKLQDKTIKVEKSSFADEQLIKDKKTEAIDTDIEYKVVRKAAVDNVLWWTVVAYNHLTGKSSVEGKFKTKKEAEYYRDKCDKNYRDYKRKTEAVDNENKVIVYQIDNTENCDYAFMDYTFAKEKGIDLKDYKKTAEVQVNTDLDGDVNSILELVFSYGNTNQEYYQENPEARSISVSDILEYNGEKYYVDTTGFEKLDKGVKTESRYTVYDYADGDTMQDEEEKGLEPSQFTIYDNEADDFYYDELGNNPVFDREEDAEDYIKKNLTETKYGDSNLDKIVPDAYCEIEKTENGYKLNCGIGDHTNLGSGNFTIYPENYIADLYEEVKSLAKEKKNKGEIKRVKDNIKDLVPMYNELIPEYNQLIEEMIKDLTPFAEKSKQGQLTRADLDSIEEITGRVSPNRMSTLPEFDWDGKFGKLISFMGNLKKWRNDLADPLSRADVIILTEATLNKFQTLTVDKDGNEMLLKDVSYNNACSWLEKELAKAGSKVVDTEIKGNKTIIKADNKTRFEYDEEKGTLKRLEEAKAKIIEGLDIYGISEDDLIDIENKLNRYVKRNHINYPVERVKIRTNRGAEDYVGVIVDIAGTKYVISPKVMYAGVYLSDRPMRECNWVITHLDSGVCASSQEYSSLEDAINDVKRVDDFLQNGEFKDELVTRTKEMQDILGNKKTEAKVNADALKISVAKKLADDMIKAMGNDVTGMDKETYYKNTLVKLNDPKYIDSEIKNYECDNSNRSTTMVKDLNDLKKALTEAIDPEAVKEKVEKAKADIGLKQAEEIVDTENELTDGIKKEIIQYAKQQGLDVEKLQKQGQLNSVAEALDNIIGEMVSKSANEFMDTTGKNIEWDFEVKDNNINVIWNEV